MGPVRLTPRHQEGAPSGNPLQNPQEKDLRLKYLSDEPNYGMVLPASRRHVSLNQRGLGARLSLDPPADISYFRGLYYSRGFTLSCCLCQLSSGRFSIRSYGE